MDTIIYNENDEIIGEITKSTTDKDYYFAGYDNKKRTRRIIKLFKGEKKAIDFLIAKNVNQVTDEENQEFYVQRCLKDFYKPELKKLLEPIVREVLRKQREPIEHMSKEGIEAWFKQMMKQVVIEPNRFKKD